MRPTILKGDGELVVKFSRREYLLLLLFVSYYLFGLVFMSSLIHPSLHLVLLALVGYFIYSALKNARKVVFSKEGILVSFLMKKTFYEFQSIQSITVNSNRIGGRYPRVSAEVLLHLKDASPLKLFAVYDIDRFNVADLGEELSILGFKTQMT